MPWKIRRNYGGCKGFAVVKENGEVVGCHANRGAAANHQQALYAAEAEAAAKLWSGAIDPGKASKKSKLSK